MTSREDLTLMIGPGPVAIGEGGYRQYIAARACTILRQSGLRVMVLENDPATLMDVGGEREDLYMEPAMAAVVKRIVKEAGVGTIWYGFAGNRGLLLGSELEEEGWHHDLCLQTPDLAAGRLCSNRYLLSQILKEHDLDNRELRPARNLREGQDASQELGFPLAVRPDSSSAGWGSGLAYNLEEYPALLGDALRDSPTGRITIEAAFENWRKYIVLLLRDREGRTVCPGIVEQVEALPKHDGDSILACPPISLTKRQGESLREMAIKAGEAFNLSGLCEFKLCLGSQADRVKLLDLDFGPGRHTPIVEMLSGADLVRIHLDLVTGKTLIGEHRLEIKKTMLVVPRILNKPVADEGYLGLGSHAVGRTCFVGENLREASMNAIEDLAEGTEDDNQRQLKMIEDILQAAGERRNRHSTKPGAGCRQVLYLSRQVDADSDCTLVIAPEGWGPHGCEQEANCFHALQGLKENNQGAALYTPSIDFALFSLDWADSVFLGPLKASAIKESAERQGLKEVVLHFGGQKSLSLANELRSSEMEVLGCESPDHVLGAEARDVLKRGGLPLVDSLNSRGFEAGIEVLQRIAYPVHAILEDNAGQGTERLLYGREDAELFLRELREDRAVIWRAVPEDVQEIQLEAVAGVEPDDLILFWEQLDEIGISSSDGLGVYPPFYMTSQQKKRATDLTRKAIAALGSRGNLSMKLFLRNGDAWIEDVDLGASANLPFLERASGLPLASLGISVLKKGRVPFDDAASRCSVVRMPTIPYGVIAESDILPSPQRRSTGSLIAIASNPAAALAKALWSQGIRPQASRIAFLSVANREKRRVVLLARELRAAGYFLMATRGTAHALEAAGIKVETVNKLKEGRPNIVDHIRNGEVGLVINIPRGKFPHSDGFYIRAASARHHIPCITNIEFALALTRGLRHSEPDDWEIMPIAGYRGLKQEIMEG